MTNKPYDDPDERHGTANGRMWNAVQNDLITDLLFQIIRVRELIKKYETMPDADGILAASILNELVIAAHQSLVDYDTVLMKKYYELLYNCD